MIELTGAWQLVSCARVAAGGEMLGHPLGAHPLGVLPCTADGRTSVHLSAAEREPPSSTDPRRHGR